MAFEDMPRQPNREGCLKGSQTLWVKGGNHVDSSEEKRPVVIIDGNIRVTVDRIRGRVVRGKVEAPTEIRVDREKVWNRRAEEDPREVLPAARTHRRHCLFDS
jgi:sRNA-binding carbon storage regulator CsrA